MTATEGAYAIATAAALALSVRAALFGPPPLPIAIGALVVYVAWTLALLRRRARGRDRGQ